MAISRQTENSAQKQTYRYAFKNGYPEFDKTERMTGFKLPDLMNERPER